MNDSTPRGKAVRSRATRRLRNLTIGTTLAGIAASAGFGWLAALTYDGSNLTTASTAGSTSTTTGSTSTTTTSDSTVTAPSTSSGTTGSSSGSSSSSSGISRSSGPAHVSTGGS